MRNGSDAHDPDNTVPPKPPNMSGRRRRIAFARRRSSAATKSPSRMERKGLAAVQTACIWRTLSGKRNQLAAHTADTGRISGTARGSLRCHRKGQTAESRRQSRDLSQSKQREELDITWHGATVASTTRCRRRQHNAVAGAAPRPLRPRRYKLGAIVAGAAPQPLALRRKARRRRRRRRTAARTPRHPLSLTSIRAAAASAASTTRPQARGSLRRGHQDAGGSPLQARSIAAGATPPLTPAASSQLAAAASQPQARRGPVPPPRRASAAYSSVMSNARV